MLVLTEREMMVGFFRKQLVEAGGAEMEELLGADLNLGDDPAAEVVQGLLDVTDADYEELVKRASLPVGERLASIKAWEKELKANRADHILSAVIIPALSTAAEKLMAAEARLAAVKTELTR